MTSCLTSITIPSARVIPADSSHHFYIVNNWVKNALGGIRNQPLTFMLLHVYTI